MPTYATIEELERLISKQILIQLTDDAKIGQVDRDVANLHLDNAEGEVNAALAAGGYAAPISGAIPPGAGIIKAATLWLAVCGLAARRGVIPQDYQTTCEYFRGFLERVAAGEVELPLESAAVNAPASTTLGQEMIFTRSKFDHAGVLRNPEERGSLDVV